MLDAAAVENDSPPAEEVYDPNTSVPGESSWPLRLLKTEGERESTGEAAAKAEKEGEPLDGFELVKYCGRDEVGGAKGLSFIPW